MNVLYKTAARATGGRDSRSATLDGTFEVSLTTPKELAGPGGDGAEPEKLYRRVGSANAANTASRRAVREAASFWARVTVMTI